MTITTVFDPPLPSDSREVFDAKAFDTVSKLNSWSSEANATAQAINDDVTDPGVVAIGNDLTGANTIGDVAAIALDVVAVAAIDADVSTVAAISSEVVAVAANEANINAAVADLPALAAKVSKTGDTMTGPLEVPAGATGAQVPRASEVTWSDGVVVSAAGTAVDVTGIPTNAREIFISFQNVQVPAAARMLLRVGNSEGVSAINYASLSSAITPEPAVGAALEVTGIAIRSGAVAAEQVNGGVRAVRQGNEWTFGGELFGSSDLRLITVVGRRYMSNLDRIRLLLSTGTFGGGQIVVGWRQ